MKRLILPMLCALASAANSPDGITPELRARFWRAQAERISAETAADRARLAQESVVNEMRKACGDGELTVAKDGEPTCATKSEPAK